VNLANVATVKIANLLERRVQALPIKIGIKKQNICLSKLFSVPWCRKGSLVAAWERERAV